MNRKSSLTSTLNSISCSFSQESDNNSSFHQIAATKNVLDMYVTYKKRVNRSYKKLEYFFGEPTPMDVCIREINKEGLKAILESKVPLCYFLYYLLDEFCSENLLFFLEVERFESKRLAKRNQNDIALSIYNTYISNNSYLEINLDDRVKRNITEQLESILTANNPSEEPSIDRYIFSEAKSCVYLLLESSFNQFLHTCVYEDMVANCGELTIYYNDHVKNLALDYLSAFTHKRNYGLSIQKIIYKFVKDNFNMDYPEFTKS
ncbi:RGS domain-containing protein [Cokeromyces recurvatus]|uniref:RGS domain-containing protein n=1 Tax=Cokeromyces recurvatus TaxID=90255 RepID=UPI0022200CA0|nr:RGS domain-containing protein [Cokeromyces recurvatus]KAI7903907.1 RGS domain-containing protein [Cokeromyces recurvatus]